MSSPKKILKNSIIRIVKKLSNTKQVLMFYIVKDIAI